MHGVMPRKQGVCIGGDRAVARRNRASREDRRPRDLGSGSRGVDDGGPGVCESGRRQRACLSGVFLNQRVRIRRDDRGEHRAVLHERGCTTADRDARIARRQADERGLVVAPFGVDQDRVRVVGRPIVLTACWSKGLASRAHWWQRYGGRCHVPGALRVSGGATSLLGDRGRARRRRPQWCARDREPGAGSEGARRRGAGLRQLPTLRFSCLAARTPVAYMAMPPKAA